MTIALVTTVGGSGDLLDRHIAFHLAVGADVVLVSGAPAGADLGAWMPRVRCFEGAGETELARLAVEEYGADWVIPSRDDEFWWPRGESLDDVLAVIPPRYRVVQALVRRFVGEASRRPEETTTRTSLLGPTGADGAPLSEWLRPVYRAEPDMVVDPDDWTLRGKRVPLRAWYPLEVLRFPAGAEASGASLEARIADGSLVTDPRLRDVLARLSTMPGPAEPIALPVPSIVDDASYAIECAAVGEVDLEGLDRQIRELEGRIGALEARLWPTVRRRLRRLARRPG
jgi:hypothetical protein